MKELTKLARQAFGDRFIACTVLHPRGVAVGHEGYSPVVTVRMGRDESKKLMEWILLDILVKRMRTEVLRK